MMPPRLTISPVQTDPAVTAAIGGLLAYLTAEQDVSPPNNLQTTSSWVLVERAGVSADSLLSGQGRQSLRQNQLWGIVERGK